MEVDHAGSAIRLHLKNTGTVACHLAVVLAPMPVAAMPIEDGQVAVDTTGRPDSVRPILGGDSAFFQWVQPGEQYELEVALEGSPATGERVVMCNEPGGYQHGRYATIRFDR
jgi:uncharacterized cupredoxin-like copper-binding protein